MNVFVSSLITHKISVESYVSDLLAAVALSCREYNFLSYAIKHKIISDSERLAQLLHILSDANETFRSLALDMYKRLGKNQLVFDILLECNFFFDAVRFLQSNLKSTAFIINPPMIFRKAIETATLEKPITIHNKVVEIMYTTYEAVSLVQSTTFMMFPGASASTFAQAVLSSGQSFPNEMMSNEDAMRLKRLLGFPGDS